MKRLKRAQLDLFVHANLGFTIGSIITYFILRFL